MLVAQVSHVKYPTKLQESRSCQSALTTDFQDVSGPQTIEVLKQLDLLLQDTLNSLRALRLSGRLLSLPELGETTFGLLAQHKFPNLLDFELDLYDTAWCPENCQQTMHSFFASSPSLQTLEVMAPYVLFDKHVTTGIAVLKRLRSMALLVRDAITHLTVNYPYAVQELPNWGYFFFKNVEHYIKSALNNLQKVSFNFPLVASTQNSDTILTNVTKDLVLHAPANSKIHFYGINVSNSTFLNILDDLTRTQVKRLSLPVPLDQSLTMQGIRALASIQHLRELSLFDRNELFTELNLSSLLEECQTHPQLLVVYVDSGGVNYLKGHKPSSDQKQGRKYTIEDLRKKKTDKLYGDKSREQHWFY